MKWTETVDEMLRLAHVNMELAEKMHKLGKTAKANEHKKNAKRYLATACDIRGIKIDN